MDIARTRATKGISPQRYGQFTETETATGVVKKNVPEMLNTFCRQLSVNNQRPISVDVNTSISNRQNYESNDKDFSLSK